MESRLAAPVFRCAVATAICTLAAAALAQDDALRPRHAVAGVVCGGDGRPVAGARVVLVGQVSPLDWAEPPDRVAVTSDADGCFRALIRDCVEYAAWATADDPRGGVLASEIRAGVTPGPRCERRLLPAASREFRVEGLDAFGGRTPTRARLWLPDAYGWTDSVAVGTDRRVLLPRDWPAAGGAIELLQDDGAMVAVARMAADASSLALAPPRELDVVVELPDGTPAAGAELTQLLYVGIPIWQLGGASRALEVRLGRADGRGRAHVVLCRSLSNDERAMRHVLLRATCPGLAAAWSGYDYEGRPFADGLPDAPTDGDTLRLRLPRAAARRGRAPLGDAPNAGCRVSVELRHDERHGNVGFYRDRTAVATTEATGRFELADVDPRDETMSVLVDEVALRAIAGARGLVRALPPGQPFLFPTYGRGDIEIDLARLATLSLEVFTPDHGPASGVEVLAMRQGGENYATPRDPHFRADNAGRATILVQEGKWFVLAFDSTRAAWRAIEVSGDASTVQLELAELPRLRVQAVDGKGHPVAGAHMVWSAYRYDTP